jgi:DNA (cytosine-5)-methyltransferase 1
MRVGSLFSGCGLLDLAFEHVGFTVAWQCECDPQARRVLAHHWPNLECFPDIRTLDPASLPPVDVLAGGFPCQDLSVAGKRQGLAGERSGLFYALTKVAYVLQPKFLVWENVPGLLSSDRGRDFARVLLELERIGFHGGWTVLDAQWFGVPQRRRRLFGVFTRRDIAPECTAEILASTLPAEEEKTIAT